MLITLSIASD